MFDRVDSIFWDVIWPIVLVVATFLFVLVMVPLDNPFMQTKSYQQGMIQELQNMQFDYVKADPEAQKALASIILHRAADFPESEMPDDLRAFIRKLRER